MKIQRIVALCKSRGQVSVFEDDEGTQWIGDGYSLYPLYGLPRFDKDSFCHTYDIAGKQQDKIAFRYQWGMPEKIDCSDAAAGEIRTDRVGLTDIALSGHVYTPCMTQKGIAFFDRSYLRPLSDEPASLDIYERADEDGEIYFAVKAGFMLKAVILPAKILSRVLVQGLNTLAIHCEDALRYAEEQDDRQLDGQGSLFQEGEKE